ncbi:colorectal mutant cancer protein-like isoform X2 [Pezoporus flaviventris]|uniref:colorectal mutant cancer protein-like isoform X2 n=1 Tax=Pezoporus flaviventris TaxID=889875 RepID=UPI002AB18626|nr:colorectal mutant cancer protein-like isoform X2 [Pezoporus flaviventris]XP_061334492.1 colorectal mutant cancer protein-like isoform X2 [Pezoporus flaviventris]
MVQSQLHLASLASLKGDIVELNKRLQQTEGERDLLEKKLAKAQCEQSHLMREHEDLQEQTTLRYEERITELHSIIAELNKKIDRLQGATIRYSNFLETVGQCKNGAKHGVNSTPNTIW